jgi:hypothetical protein
MRGGRLAVKVLRFADAVKSGFAAGKRVFIRADLNVPPDEAGEPGTNMGIGSLRANLPHLVGEHLLKVTKSVPALRKRKR